jgi:hypothetical protein
MGFVMKDVVVILLVLFASTSATAQVTARAPDLSGISVLKFSWSKERIGWEQDPFGGPIESFDEMRVRTRNEKRVMDAKKGGNGSEVSRAERDAKTDEALIASIHKNTNTRYVFVYKLLLQNNDARPIKSIDWDYVFSDVSTGQELGRRQFTSLEKVGAGKTRELKFFIPIAPTKTISVSSLNKHEREGLSEAIVIVRVEYADGSLWQRQ